MRVKSTKRDAIHKDGEGHYGDALAYHLDPFVTKTKRGEDIGDEAPFHSIKSFFNV
jgi:hypothetical protein